jgi:CHAT domain-containing protein/tetratricopeptide (TPR) repeat protein
MPILAEALMHRRPRSQLLSLVAAASLLSALVASVHVRAGSVDGIVPTQAQTALDAGKTALRHNRADEALPQLQNALALFTQAHDATGAAAARDQIGDIYQRYGQYQTALDNYQSAYDTFCGARQQANANLMLVKIGETRYLSADADGARAAFARMNQCNGSNGGVVAAGDDRNRRRDGVAFLPVGAALSLASCPAFSQNNNNVANNTPNEPTFGHGPTNSSRPSVRMDLRVVDQDGNPIKGVKAKLESERGADGLLCECTHFTDGAGKVLMDPIHFNHTLSLALNANGFEPLQISVDPSELNQPYKVALQAKGAAAGANPPGHVPFAARLASGAANPAACFDLYSFFASYAFGEMWRGRSDYDTNNLAAARTHYENVLSVSDTTAPTGNLQLARLFRAVARTNLGDIALREGRFADAAQLYRQAVEGAQKDNRLELAWAAQRGLGRSLWSLAQQSQDANAARQREDALNAFRAALKTVETLLAGSLRADEARANFLATTRDLFDDAASAFAESALTAATTPAQGGQSFAHAALDQRGQTTARPPLTRQPANRAPVNRAPVDHALTGRALAYAAEAFRVTEQGRARALLDLIGESRANITEGVPADLLARRSENAARQQEIADMLRGVHAPAAPTPKDSVAKLETELERLGSEFDAIENQIRVASPRYNTLVRAQPLSLAEVQRQVLDDGTALLEYSLGRERSYLFAVTKSGLALYRLPSRAVVESQVFELRKQLVPVGARRAIAGIDTGDAQRGVSEDLKAAAAGRGLVLGGPAIAPQVVHAYAAAASALYNTVVAPAAQFVGASRLLVVADGALNFVPFEALVTKADAATDYSSLSYLVKTNEIVYAPSASVVAAVRAARAASAAQSANARGVLVVADPVFDAADSRASGKNFKPHDETAQRAALKSAISDVANLKSPQSPRLMLVRLAGTRSEGEQIAALARANGGAADLWLDFDASEANLRRHQLDGYRVIHFATHGLLDTDRPQFTGLALSLVGDPDDDGFLRVGEVFNLHLGSPLVVLSACETGLGKENRGEGVIGLARAFMYAGAPSVGVSLWSVADRSTAELMPDFYKRYLAAQGHAPATALRAAQQQMIAGKRYSAPFYWAPFVLVGDWK